MKTDDSLPIRFTHGVLCQFAILIIAMSSALAVVPSVLRCEYLSDPLGVDVPLPRLSCKLVDDAAVRGQKQTAFHSIPQVP